MLVKHVLANPEQYCEQFQNEEVSQENFPLLLLLALKEIGKGLDYVGENIDYLANRVEDLHD